MPTFEKPKTYYKVLFLASDFRIKPIQVIKETEKTVVVLYEWNGKQRERRQAKQTNYDQIFATFDAAKNWASHRIANKIQQSEKKLVSLKKEQKKINQLQESDLKCD